MTRKRTSLVFSFLTSVALLLALPVGAATAADLRFSEPSDEIDNFLRSVVQEDLYQTQVALEDAGVYGVGSIYDAVILDSELTAENELVIRYNPQDPLSPSLLEAIDRAATQAPLTVRATPINVDPGELQELATEISLGGDYWLSAFGVPDIVAVLTDGRTGQLTVSTSADIEPRETVVEGVTFILTGNAIVDFQSRASDYAPWTGGGLLTNGSSATCTMGFNWRKWAPTEFMGSTAEHCFEATGSSWWYNNGNSVGVRYYYSTTRDTMLFRSPTINQFNNTVWVGGPYTNDLRTVTSASATDVFGAVVAFGGGYSGYASGTNSYGGLTLGGKGPWRLTNIHSCIGGDSGAPWLTAHSDLTINAEGQHGGYYNNGAGLAGCFYMPVTPIAAALNASILI